MAEESIKYLINADDNATVKFQAARQELEKSAKAVQEMGSRAKAATEFTGTLANMLGGTQLGGAATLIADITGKITALSGSLKAGGAAAMAFKAALVVGVVAAVYTVTRQIADAVMGVEKWREKLKESFADSAKTADFLIAKQEKRLNLEIEIAKATVDQNQKSAESQAILADIEKQIKEQAKVVKEAQESAEARTQEWGYSLGFLSDAVEADKALLDTEQKRLDALKSMRENAKDQLGLSQQQLRAELERRQAEAKGLDFVEKLKSEVEDMAMSEDARIIKLAQQNTATHEQYTEALSLLAAKKKILETQEAEKIAAEKTKAIEAEKAKALQTRLAEEKRIFDIQDDMLKNLKQQVILQKDGSVAARAFGLEQQGVSAEMAKMFATFEDDLAKIGEKAKEVAPASNNAVESRLLTGTQTIDQRAVEAKRLQQINEEQKKLLGSMDKRLEQIKQALSAPTIVIGT